MKFIRHAIVLLGGVLACTLFAAADRPPKPVNKPAAICPLEFLKKKTPGYAIAEFTVGEDGSIKDLRTVEGTNKAFEMSVLVCVSHWKFRPAVKADKAVETRMRYRFDFSAGEREADDKAEPLPADAPAASPK